MKWKHLAWIVPLFAAGVIVALILTRSKSGSALLYARGTDSTTLDPAEVQWGEDVKVITNIYETLVTFGEDSTDIVPGLAESWKGEGTTWTFRLRGGVKFQDGTPLDGEAVAFTFRRLLDSNHPYRPKKVPYGSNFQILKEVAGKGGTVSFTLREPNATFLQILAMFPASIVSPEAVKKHWPRFNQNPCGTGPYRLSDWRPMEKLTLERFDGYWGKKPEIARVIFLPVKSHQSAIEKLKRGEAHIVDNISLADVKIVENEPNLYVDTETSLNVAYLGFNLKVFPYSNLHFRRAVGLAIDRRELNSLVYYGQAEAARNIVPPAVWRKTGELAPYEFDLEKAKQELKKVGLSAGFTVEIWHMTFPRPYMPEPHRVAEYLKNQLVKLGLDVKLRPFEKSAYTPALKDPAHPMYLLGWSADYADPDNFFFPLLHGESGDDLNNSFFNHPEFNSAVSRAQRESDPGKRATLYRRAAEIYRAEMPTLPLVHVKQVTACSRRVVYNRHPIEVRLYPARFK